MSNLIPEVRPDRNGKMVTRHVKADNGASAANQTLPAPKVAQEPGKRQKINYIMEFIQSAYDNHVKDIMSFYGEETTYDEEYERLSELSPRRDEMDEALSMLPLSTVDHLRHKIMDSGFDDDFQMILPEVLQDVRSGRTASSVELFTYLFGRDDIISTDDEMFAEEVSTYQLLKTMVDGVNGYQHLGYTPPQSIFAASEEEKELVRTLCKMRFLQPVDDEYDVMSLPDSVENDDLVRIVLKNPGQAGRVVELMHERETDDAELIRRIIESESQGLSSGNL